MAFDGYSNFECRTIADIVFGFSTFGAKIEKENKSHIKHYIVSGLLNDYNVSLLKNQAIQIEIQLLNKGVKK